MGKQQQTQEKQRNQGKTSESKGEHTKTNGSRKKHNKTAENIRNKQNHKKLNENK